MDINLTVHQPPLLPVPAAVPTPYSMDANASIDNLTRRLKTLEFRIGDLEAEDVNSYHVAPKTSSRSSKKHSRSPSRRSRHEPSSPTDEEEIIAPAPHAKYIHQQQQHQETIQFLTETLKELLHKIQKYKNNSNELTQTVKLQYQELTHQIADLQTQNKELSQIIHRVESANHFEIQQLIEKLHENEMNLGEIGKGKELKKDIMKDDRQDEAVVEDEAIEYQFEKKSNAINIFNEQYQHLSKKLKLLTYNTNKVCKALSIGISDSQYSILSIYSWADKLYLAMEKMSREMGKEKNICPRLRLHNEQTNENDEDMMINIPTYFHGNHDEKMEMMTVFKDEKEWSSEDRS